jgi:hypothetical protein
MPDPEATESTRCTHRVLLSANGKNLFAFLLIFDRIKAEKMKG